MKTLKPFANESDALAIGELNVENRLDRVSVYGNVDLTRDKAGLQQARDLKALVDRIVEALEAERNLPDQVAAPEPAQTVKNPFA